MTSRARKLVGTPLCVAFLVLYCLLAMAVGARFFIDVPAWLQGAYFVLAGVLWIPIAMALIRWMLRPA